MQYRINPKNGDTLSILGYGCMRFSKTGGVITNQKKTEEELLYAYENGVNYFDTAYIYPGSEAALGKFIAKIDRSKIFIATKLPHSQCRKKEDFEKIFSEQLSRLGTDYIDYYLIHMLSDTETFERLNKIGFAKWAAEKKSAGKIRNLGFSYHGSSSEFKKIIDCFDFDFCQIQFNYMDETTQAGSEGLFYAAEKGLPVIIMEPLRGGKLSRLSGSSAKIIESAEPKRSASEWALRWIWNYPQVTVVLSGMNDIEQVKENVRVASEAKENELSESQLEMFREIKEEINRETKIQCTGCAYCMPCPHGVDIPSCFAAYNRCYTDGYLSGFISYIMTTSLKESKSIASKCVSCGLCEKKCPQHLLIRENLQEVSSVLEGVMYKTSSFVGNVFLKKRIR
ncbi:MAG: aldo/keto reductase [Methanocorpusculum sp.]|nr:aldo/keto reductase [Methanocorpusculum sp.]